MELELCQLSAFHKSQEAVLLASVRVRSLSLQAQKIWLPKQNTVLLSHDSVVWLWKLEICLKRKFNLKALFGPNTYYKSPFTCFHYPEASNTHQALAVLCLLSRLHFYSPNTISLWRCCAIRVHFFLSPRVAILKGLFVSTNWFPLLWVLCY